MMSSESSKNMGANLFGDNIEEKVLLRDKFLEPPFSILDTNGGDWQNRKRNWKSLGIKSEVSREGINLMSTQAFASEKYGRTSKDEMSGVSIFDPALTELMYNWFCPAGGYILDPFAGGSVRGIVAAYLGYNYVGCELRPEQVYSNRDQAKEIITAKSLIQPEWYIGDSEETLSNISLLPDMIFSCPPYHDLEVYSDQPDDLSNMPYDKFVTKYTTIIHKACAMLKPGGYAVFVVGDIRDKKGNYKGFTMDTINAFRSCGMYYYNHAILRQPIGTAMLRANKVFGTNKKLVKVHEDILIFLKP